MSDNRGFSHAKLIGGPYEGRYALAEIQLYESYGALRIPVDEHFITSTQKPFAHAVYENAGIPSDRIKFYWFRRYARVDGGSFLVELVGGPLAGTRPMHQPVLGLPQIVMIPVKSEPAREQDGRLRVFAVYKNGAFLGGDHKLIFEREQRDVVKDHRVIFELSGGPFDGVTYDTDAGMLDPESKFRAGAFYAMTDEGTAGKRFVGLSPHSMQALDEFGDAARNYGGPFQPHMYEVSGKVEAPYEIYVHAKYAGLHPPNPPDSDSDKAI